MRTIGIILIVIGIVGLTYGGFSYTRDKKVLEVGDLEVHTDQKKTVPIPPLAGGAALLTGALLIVTDRRRVS